MSYSYPYPIALFTALAALLAALIGAFVSLSVSRRQFSANVLAANRQRWIDGFRDRLAELLAVISAAQVVKRHSAERWRGGAGPVKDNPALADKLEKTFLAIAQIQLLTNGAEPEHQALNSAITAAVGRLQEDELHEAQLAARLQEIVALGRGIIRREWARVKRGE